MNPATTHILVEHAARLGAPLDGDAVRRFHVYQQLLARWNARINLTRIVDETEVVAKHFLDSLAVVPALGEAAATLVDVGAGAGFPGVPAAIARPALRVTLVESTQKKCAFLEALKRELALDLTVVAERLEHLVPPAAGFDAAVSRAMLAPQGWLDAGARLVAPGGRIVVMLGRERASLVPPAGFDAPVERLYELPLDATRSIVTLRRSG